VCVHCGLCAERCPTAAWDMQRFVLQIPYAGAPAAIPAHAAKAESIAK
jgi:formate dehydrogenase (NADP+) beta subunit